MNKHQGNDAELMEIAQAVTDGTPVDWMKEIEVTPRSLGLLRNLQAIDKIGAFYRDTAETSPTATATQKIPDPEPLPIESWGSLTLVGRLGRGTYGEVFVAHDPGLQIDVALKLLKPREEHSPAGDDAYLTEARKLARVRHPNVVRVHGVARHEGRTGLWMNLIVGQTLEEQLAQAGRLSAEEATHIGIELCRALAAVHAAGLIHGDVKTANIMREKGGLIVLMDFSSAEESGGNRIAGTPAFMAPELFQGSAASRSSDIYSLGAVLYRLVSGRYPIEGESLSEIREKHLQKDVKPLRDVRPDLPAAFVKVVERALNPDPGDRYESAGEMERALNSLQAVPVRPTPAARWRRYVVAAAATVALVVLGTMLRSVVFPGFEVEASLFRLTPGSEERLRSGATVNPGDQLFLEIEGSEKMYVYVLNEDSLGDAFLLFPLPVLDLQNPVSSDVVYRLPGEVGGTENFWDVTTAGGTETLLVIASRDPVADLKETMDQLAQVGGAGPVPDRVFAQLRGIGGLNPEAIDPAGGTDSPIADVTSRLTVRAAKNSGLWIWEMMLSNPGR